jgi:hypothetical protein
MTRPGHYSPKDRAYEDQPRQVKHREERNVAHRHIKKDNPKALSGNRDVGHKVPLDRGGSNRNSNLAVETIAKNRGWRKGESGYVVPKEK